VIGVGVRFAVQQYREKVVEAGLPQAHPPADPEAPLDPDPAGRGDDA
jgi:hypothetical protein